MPIKEFHLNKVLEDLGLNYEEVSAYLKKKFCSFNSFYKPINSTPTRHTLYLIKFPYFLLQTV